MNSKRLLAVDGGGTSTTAWLSDGAGMVLGHGEAGPSNAKVVGLEVARANLHRAISLAFADAGANGEPSDLACFGLAGFDRPDDQYVVAGWSESARWTRRMIVVNDGDMVLAAGTPEGYGVGLMAATGSIAVGRAPSGLTARAGGWGHLMGDEGSAYAVAQAGLRWVARRADGRQAGRAGIEPLTARICEALGLAEPSGLVSAIYAPSFDTSRIASLAPIVVAAAEDDPEIAERILVPAGTELARAVAAVINRLDQFPGLSGPIPLAISGGFILSARVVMNTMLERLAQWGHKVSPYPVDDPVRGALILAQRALAGHIQVSSPSVEIEEPSIL